MIWEKMVKVINKTNENGSIRFSIRISGSVTSISLRKNIIALWLVMNGITDSKSFHNYILDFIYKCLSVWQKNDAKGFSDYVSACMIEDLLSGEDFVAYKQVFQRL